MFEIRRIGIFVHYWVDIYGGCNARETKVWGPEAAARAAQVRVGGWRAQAEGTAPEREDP